MEKREVKLVNTFTTSGTKLIFVVAIASKAEASRLVGRSLTRGMTGCAIHRVSNRQYRYGLIIPTQMRATGKPGVR